MIFSLKCTESKALNKVNVLVSQSKPFVILENRPIKGLDIEILNMFGKKYNLEIEYIISNTSLNEAFCTDESFKHFTQSMKNFSKFDIFIGALDENLLTKKELVASYPYYQNRLTWCVQKRKPIPVRQNIFHLCNDPLVWGIFIIGAFGILATAYLFQQFEPRQNWDWNRLFFDGLRCFFNLPCAYNPEVIGNRILFAFTMFASTIFGIVLNTGLLLFTTHPILKPQIQSIQEVIDGNFRLIGDGFTFQKILEQSQVGFSELEK